MRLPAEYESQSAVWLTWPGNPATWPDCRKPLEEAYAHFVAVISRYQSIELICCKAWEPVARQNLQEQKADTSVITWHDWPVNDAWCRDHGPLFVKSDSGEKELIDFRYNAWGGKFPPWDDDDALPKRISELRKMTRYRVPNVGEGGALEVNSEGLLLTTKSVWLNKNRNPGWTEADAEQCFSNYLGVKDTLWLEEGLIGDDTDGHIDTLSRFINDETVVSSLCDPKGINFPVLKTNFDRLQERIEVIPLPHPDPVVKEGEILPATYANFLILNQAVLVPTYAQPQKDTKALGVLAELFPDRRVCGIPSEVFIREGGSLHCLSMQECRSLG